MKITKSPSLELQQIGNVMLLQTVADDNVMYANLSLTGTLRSTTETRDDPDAQMCPYLAG